MNDFLILANNAPQWLQITIGWGTFGIMICAKLYSKLIIKKYNLKKNPFDIINIICGLLFWVFLMSPYNTIFIGVFLFVILIIRNIIIIKSLFPIIIMTLLTICSFFNLFWLIPLFIMKKKK
jgi:hypothetical protein